MLKMARDYGSQLQVCRPYSARTKGKVDRFNGYLNRSFIVPLAATLRAGGLKVDVATANRELMRWRQGIANTRKHATTGCRPLDWLIEEQVHLGALPIRNQVAVHAVRTQASFHLSRCSIRCRSMTRCWSTRHELAATAHPRPVRRVEAAGSEH